MKNLFIFFLYPLLTLGACNQTILLTDKDYSWMPYKGNEILVFKSNTKDTDTIFFIRKDTLLGYPDPALSTAKFEEVAIFSKHSDAYMSTGHRYLESYFLKIKKTMSKKAEIVFALSARDAKFYRLNPIKIDSLCRIKLMPFTTSYKHYEDVYIIDAEDYTGSFYQRSDFVTKLYWSKSEGLIRYDKKNGVYWELLK